MKDHILILIRIKLYHTFQINFSFFFESKGNTSFATFNPYPLVATIKFSYLWKLLYQTMINDLRN